MALRRLLCLLEERLVHHDNNRKEVQGQLQEICAGISKEAELAEENICGEIHKSFDEKENRVLGLVGKLNDKPSTSRGRRSDVKYLVKQAQGELMIVESYEIETFECAEKLSDSLKLIVTTAPPSKKWSPKKRGTSSKPETLAVKLQENLNKTRDSMADAKDKIAKICSDKRNESKELEKDINETLEVLFSQEDARIQSVVKQVKESIHSKDPDVLKELESKAKMALLVNQKYSLECFPLGRRLCDKYGFTIAKEASLEVIDFDKRKPTDLAPSFTEKGDVSVSFAFFTEDEEKVLMEFDPSFVVEVVIWEKGHESSSKTFTEEYSLKCTEPLSIGNIFTSSTTYCLKMRIVHKELSTEWSDVAELIIPEFKDFCVWKECPNNVHEKKKYSVDKTDSKIVTKVNGSEYLCSAIGNVSLPLNTVISWSIKVLQTKYSGEGLFIGVAPSDINQDEGDNPNKCGWYFDCLTSTLYSGPPHNYRNKEYGVWKGEGEYVHTGDSVGVVMDTAKGELSFVVGGVNLGVAFEGIPLDKPLVPCVLLYYAKDSVKLDTSEVKENMDSSIPAPSNITAKSSTWDSIALTWDAVDGASFYQIEVDGSKSWHTSATNAFTKRGLLPETEHTFRVRAVRGNSVSEWGDVVKGRTERAPESTECYVWKECPGYVDKNKKYSVVEENSRIATKIDGDDDFCTIIGDIPLPFNKATSWNIKVLKSRNNNGDNIFIGIAPSDINQNEGDNPIKCGWYFYCYCSALVSGPPHNYRNKEYGPRKGKGWGKYVHTGDSVGVVMDTAKGELSFALDELNLGVAYEGIPLDKPLVPCVLLGYEDDSVELDASEAKETVVDSFIPVPSNITTNSITWDSITLTWDAVEGASFYQIEVDGSKSLDASTANSFTKRGLLPDTEHTFRARAVRGDSVSEWSDVVKGMTQKKSFESSWWKECPDNVDKGRKYSVNGKKSRIATMLGGGMFSFCPTCTIIGNTPLPLNTVISWNVKILRSWIDTALDIHIGVAPSDIDQSNDEHNTQGWFFNCWSSSIWSGVPGYCEGRDYGLRDGAWGSYFKSGSSVGVVMDTTNGDLSFAIYRGVDLGVAFEGIPLDKPLVPCVLLRGTGDSVKLYPSIENPKENLNPSILVPSAIAAKSGSWDSITLTWNPVKGASFYLVGVENSKILCVVTENVFKKDGLLPDTEHGFRVRVVCGNEVGKWSRYVSGRTQKIHDFSECVWKECPDDVFDEIKYSLDEKSPRIASRIGGNNDDDELEDLDLDDGDGDNGNEEKEKKNENLGIDKDEDNTNGNDDDDDDENSKEYPNYCTIVGDTSFPLNTMVSWDIRILKLGKNDKSRVFIGVAPFGISIHEEVNCDKCGWYFDCYNSTLCSGPPHNYEAKEYGPRKENGEYVHIGDSVGVVMDTIRGRLSFVVNRMNLGVAYKGIPLDKPLMPCVLLGNKGDSVELISPGIVDSKTYPNTEFSLVVI